MKNYIREEIEFLRQTKRGLSSQLGITDLSVVQRSLVSFLELFIGYSCRVDHLGKDAEKLKDNVISIKVG